MQWRWLTESNFNLVATGVGIIVSITVIIQAVAAGVTYLRTRRIAVERMITSHPEIGNTLTIVNLSDKPLMISAWDIVWARGRPWGRTVTMGAFDGNEDSVGFTIPPHERKRFNFLHEHHFPTGRKTQRRNGRLYCRIWLAGDGKARWFKLL